VESCNGFFALLFDIPFNVVDATPGTKVAIGLHTHHCLGTIHSHRELKWHLLDAGSFGFMRLTSSYEKQGGGETRAEADQDKWQSGTKADQDQQDQQDQHRPRGRALFPRQTGTRADQVAERHKGRPGPAQTRTSTDQDQHRPRGRALFPRQTGTRADQVAENRMEVTPPGPVSGQCWGHLRAKSFPPNNKSNE